MWHFFGRILYMLAYQSAFSSFLYIGRENNALFSKERSNAAQTMGSTELSTQREISLAYTATLTVCLVISTLSTLVLASQMAEC